MNEDIENKSATTLKAKADSLYMSTKAALLTACDRLGGQHAIARVLGLKSQGTIAYWLKMGRPPPKWVLRIERHTGVSRHELRPDIYPIEMRTRSN